MIKVHGGYQPGGALKKLTLGLGFFASSGTPITAFVWNPGANANNFVGAPGRGGYGRTIGSRASTSTPTIRIPLGRESTRQLQLIVDVFNLANSQGVSRVWQGRDLSATTRDPNFLKPYAYQAPRDVRFGVRVEF